MALYNWIIVKTAYATHNSNSGRKRANECKYGNLRHFLILGIQYQSWLTVCSFV